MSDTADIKPKDDKRPTETAANALRETFTKEWQGKLKDQTKKTMDAARIFTNEKKALRALVDDYEADKAEFNAAIKEIL